MGDADLGTLLLKMQADTAGFNKSMLGATNIIKGAGVAVGVMATAITGTLAIATKKAIDFEAGMANVATLLNGDVTPRIGELSDEIRKLQRYSGESAETLQDGLYQTISALGDTADSMDILQIATEGAVAGNATVTDSVNLLSAVMKGYNNVSAENAQNISDLAFKAVKLGQTTFPELASSMGKVIPIANAMSVGQEELFGVMATLTGVTGNTAEVVTQLRASLVALAKPTDTMVMALKNAIKPLIDNGTLTGDMVDKYKALDSKIQDNIIALGQLERAETKDKDAIKAKKTALEELQKEQDSVIAGMGNMLIESQGLQGAMGMLTEYADGNNAVLGDMFGRVEALNGVLALTGSQAETLTAKTSEMKDAVGATSDAFNIQADTVERMSKRVKEGFNTILEKIGEEVLPVLDKLLGWVIENLPAIEEWFKKTWQNVKDFMAPVVDFVKDNVIPRFKELGNWFKDNMPAIKEKAKEVFEGVKSYMEPVRDFVTDHVVPAFKSMGDWWQENGGEIRDKAKEVFGGMLGNMENVRDYILDKLSLAFDNIKAFWDENGDAIKQKVIDAFDGIKGAMETVTKFWEEKLKPHFDAIRDWVMQNAPEIKQVFTESFGAILDSFKEIWEFVKWTFKPLFEEMFKGDDVENWAMVLDTALGLAKIAIEVATAPLRIFAGILRQIREDVEKVKAVFSGDRSIGDIFRDTASDNLNKGFEILPGLSIFGKKEEEIATGPANRYVAPTSVLAESAIPTAPASITTPRTYTPSTPEPSYIPPVSETGPKVVINVEGSQEPEKVANEVVRLLNIQGVK